MSGAAMYRTQYATLSREELLEEACKLKDALEQERKRSGGLADEVRQAREHTLTMQNQLEQEEECLINKLMKRLEQLKKEKQILANEVEQEEEFLTNTLQKKLDKLNKEKVELEVRLEAEQEYVVNKLRKQLDQLAADKASLHRDKVDLENQLEAEQEYIMNKLTKQVDALAADKGSLQRERSLLQQQVSHLASSVDKLNRDKVALENTLEAEEESIVNRLTRQLEVLAGSYRALEARLEARGISIKELGLGPAELPTGEGCWVPYNRAHSRASSGELSRSWGHTPRLSSSSGPGAGPGGSSGGGGLCGRRPDRPMSSSSGPAAAAVAVQPPPLTAS